MTISGRYTWEESEVDITIHVPFRGKSIKKLDIFVADVVLKVSHPPFLLDLNLNKPIQTKTPKAILKDGTLVINLKKVLPGLWYELIHEGLSKEKLKERRRDSLRRREEEIRQQHENVRSKRVEEERMTVRKQMDLDDAEFQHIEDLKKKEKLEAEEVLYNSMATWTMENKEKETTCTDSSSKMMTTIRENDKENSPKIDKIEQYQNNHQKVSIQKDEIDCNKNIEILNSSPIQSLPSVREASRVEFKHTPRVFKTPIRESTILREKEFLVRNRPYLHKNKYLNCESNSNMSEVDPVWLKKKGDDFFRGGDYLSAINAYSEAFEKDGTFFQSLTNRSLCYLHIGEMKRSICDGKDALQIIKNEMNDSSLTSSELISLQKKVLTRIATAQYHVGGTLSDFKKALGYLQEAANLGGSDESLAKDIERVKVVCEAVKLKGKGDAFLADDKIESAIKSYKKAILKESALLSAKVNCATAFLLQGSHEECILLCGEVLNILKATGPCKHNGVLPIGTIPLPRTERRRKLAVATLHKRAEASMSLGKFDQALKDLEAIQTIGSFVEDETNLDNDIAQARTRLHAQTCC